MKWKFTNSGFFAFCVGAVLAIYGHPITGGGLLFFAGTQLR